MTGDLVAYICEAAAAPLSSRGRREHRTAFLSMLMRLGITPRMDTAGALMVPVTDAAQGFGVDAEEMIEIAGGPSVVRLADPADLVSLH